MEMGMTWTELWASAVCLAMAIVVALIVFAVVRTPLGRMLSMNSRLAACRSFFVRSLLAVLLLVSIGLVAGDVISLPEGSARMEYVWAAAGKLNEVLGLDAVVLGGFVVVTTILVIGLGRHHDE